jgi:stalled ribosome rescue protein Dom34
VLLARPSVRRYAPVLDAAEAVHAQLAANQLVGAVRADALGVAGLEATLHALAGGQVDRLLLHEAAEFEDDTRAQLVRMAAISGAHVEVVRDHVALRDLGGVGALLRYRHAAPSTASK